MAVSLKGSEATLARMASLPRGDTAIAGGRRQAFGERQRSQTGKGVTVVAAAASVDNQ